MRSATIGTGRVGANTTARPLQAGRDVVTFHRDPGRVQPVVDDGGTGASSLERLAGQLEPTFWAARFELGGQDGRAR